MKKLLGIVVLGLLLSGNVNADCYNCESEAYDGYRDSKRAYYSSDLDDCQYYARKAMRHASYTEDYARGCD